MVRVELVEVKMVRVELVMKLVEMETMKVIPMVAQLRQLEHRCN